LGSPVRGLGAAALGDEAALELAVDLGDGASAALSAGRLVDGTSMSNRPIVIPPRVA
jgi:hypothetical protein